jgi:WD40 repeat protein
MSRFDLRLFGIACLALLLSNAARSADDPVQVTSPDGKTFASASRDKVILIDAASKKEIRKFGGHEDLVTALAFSPDGRVLASGSQDKMVRLWDPATGKPLHVLKGTDGIEEVTFSKDGKTVTAKQTDKTMRVWEVASGKEISESKQQ